MMTILGRLTRNGRIRSGLTALEVSQYSGLTIKELADLEWQQATDIDCFQLTMLARCLDLAVSELLGEVQSIYSSPTSPTTGSPRKNGSR
jgi:hypothetical protein